MNAYLLDKAVEYHGKELFDQILAQNNCLDKPYREPDVQLNKTIE